MHVENSVEIYGSFEKIFRLAAEVERWPEILPHYRWVKRLSGTSENKVVAMAACRDWIPVKWVSIQEVNPQEQRIIFRHIGGFTKGMFVEWNLTPLEATNPDTGYRVRIEHQFSLKWPLIGTFIAHKIVGEFFVQYIANKTLQRIKTLVEAQAAQPNERVAV